MFGLSLSQLSADQLVIWHWNNAEISGITSGSNIFADAVNPDVTGVPVMRMVNGAIDGNGKGGTSYFDAAGVTRTSPDENDAIAWNDIRTTGVGELHIILDTTGFTDLGLRFDYKYQNLEDGGDDLMVLEFSTNSGSSYTVYQPFSIRDNNSFDSRSFDLGFATALNNTPSVILRLRPDPAAATQFRVDTELRFDNVEVTGTPFADPDAPVLTVDTIATTSRLDLPAEGAGALSGVIADPTDPASTAGIEFDLADANQSAGSLILSAASSNAGVVPNSSDNLVFSGTGADRNLKIVPTGVGKTTITVTVSDSSSKTDTYTLSYAASAGSSTASTSRFHTGSADASSALSFGDAMLVANDEDQVLRVYLKDASGLPTAAYDLNADLNLGKEADLEASFALGNRNFWLGSHGNDRSGDIEPTRHLAFSTDNAVPGTPSPVFVGSYTGMRTDLVAWDAANGHGLGANALGFAAGTQAGVTAISASGFNIEGAALAPDSSIYLGFRAPLRSLAPQSGRALMVPVTNFTDVVSGTAPGPMVFGAPVFLDLGGRAIRGMSRNARGDYLILAGPVGDAGPTFELFFWDGSSAPVLLTSNLNALAVNSGGSPESILDFDGVLTEGAQVRVLMDNGATIQYADGTEAKDQIANWRKFRGDTVYISSGVPGSIEVTTVDDETDGIETGFVSLREAIEAVQTGGKITFASGLAGAVIPLDNQLVVRKPLTIDASAHAEGVTLSGQRSHRILKVVGTGLVQINRVHFSNGNAIAGADGNNGGAIYIEDGGLALAESLVRANEAENGGGIFIAEGSLTTNGCAVLENSATANGGGIYNNSDREGRTTVLRNTTIAGNACDARGGGLFNFDGDSRLLHCTVVGNRSPGDSGGGVANYADNLTVTVLQNSLVRNNFGNDLQLAFGTTQSFVSFGGNIAGDGDGIPGINLPSDLVGTGTPVRLSEPGWFGGPTPAIHPLAGSPAIDGAAIGLGGVDQRGFPREVGPGPDVGAVEVGPVILVDNAGVDPATATTLPKAIADGTAPGTVIRFDPAVFNGRAADTVTLANPLNIAGQAVFIDASNIARSVTVSGGGTSRLFNLSGGSDVAMHSLQLENASASGYGGAVFSDSGRLTLQCCRVTGSFAANGGGGVSSENGSLWIHGSTFSGNTTDGSGGGIDVFGSSLELRSSTVSGNRAGSGGGGVILETRIASDHAAIVNSTFFGNEAGAEGGAVYNLSGGLNLSFCTITGNKAAPGQGGGVASRGVAADVRTEIRATLLRDNSSDADFVGAGENTFATLDFNRIGTGNALSAFAASGDQSGIATAQPLTLPGWYGGKTKVRHPLAAAQLADVATGSLLPVVDQRGHPRNVGAGSDVGAVEQGPVAVVTAAVDDPGLPGDIRDAVGSAPSGGVIRFNLPSGVVTLNGLLPVNGKDLFFDGTSNPGGTVVLDANAADRVFSLSGSAIAFESMIMTNGNTTGDGGAVHIDGGSLQLTNSSITNANTTGKGGAMLVAGGATVCLRNSTISGSTSTDLAGAIMCFSGAIDITNSTLAENNAPDAGPGAVWVQGTGSSLRIVHSTISRNTGNDSAVLLLSTGVPVIVENSIIAGNTPSNTGFFTGSDLRGANLLMGTPLLAPLGPYAGGSTATMPPLPGSQAIEGARLLASSPDTDQAGKPRPQNALPDLGAFEAVPIDDLALTSSDGDAIPDILEGPDGPYPHLSPLVDDSTVDTDGDGSTDAAEIGSMTNLLDPNSVFKILSFDYVTGDPFNQVLLEWTTYPGLSYSVEISESLDFTSPRTVPFFSAPGFTIDTVVNVAPAERYVRVRRN